MGRPSFFGITMLQFRMIDTPTIRAAPFWKTPLNNFHNASLMAEIWRLEPFLPEDETARFPAIQRQMKRKYQSAIRPLLYFNSQPTYVGHFWPQDLKIICELQFVTRSVPCHHDLPRCTSEPIVLAPNHSPMWLVILNTTVTLAPNRPPFPTNYGFASCPRQSLTSQYILDS